MKEASSYISTIEKKLADKKSLEEELANIPSEEAEKIKQSDAEIDNRAQALRSDIIGLKPIVQNLLKIYPSVFSAVGMKLAVHSSVAPSFYKSTDDYKQISERAVNILKNGFSSVFGGLVKIDTAAPELASAYNTLVELWSKIPEIKLLAAEDIKAAYRKKAAAIRQRLSELSLATDISPEMLESIVRRTNKVKISTKSELFGENSFSDSLRLEVGFRSNVFGGTECITDVLAWDMSREQTLRIYARKEAEAFVPRTIAGIILQLFKSYSLSNIKLLLCGIPVNEENLLGKILGTHKKLFLASSVNKTSSASGTLAFNDPRVAGEKIFEIANTCSERMSTIKDGMSILEHNKSNPEISYPIYLIVIDRYNQEANEKLYSALSSVVNMKKHGVYTLIIERESECEENTEYRSYGKKMPMISENPDVSQMELSLQNGDVCISASGAPNEYYSADLFESDFNIDAIDEAVSRQLEREKSFLPWKKLLAYMPKITDDFSKEITLPVGIEGTLPSMITLGTKDEGAHAAIAGETGSGKSSLLQSIILGGAYAYSPEQLQFWIIDLKDGTGLTQFKELKHVRMISLRNRKSEIGEILDFLDAERARRSLLFKKRRVGNSISDYNKKMRELGEEIMPRLFVIIDEFSNMPAKCIKNVSEIAKTGRSYGISLIICSQEFADSGDVSQMAHRYEFITPRPGRLIDQALMTPGAEAYIKSAIKGRALYGYKDKLQKLRVAYAGEYEEQCALIGEINRKWANTKAEPTLVTGEPQRISIPFGKSKSDKSAKDPYDIRPPLGRQRLGNEYLFELSSKPILFLSGDGGRSSSIEYSIANAMLGYDAVTPSVYYIDLSPANIMRRERSRMRYLYGNPSVRTANNANALEVLNEIYKIYNERYLGNLDNTGLSFAEPDMPIEVIIHHAENLPKIFSQAKNTPLKRAPEAYSFGNKDLDDIDLMELMQDSSMPLQSIDTEPSNISEKEFAQMCQNAWDYSIHFTVFRPKHDSVYEDVFGSLCKKDSANLIITPQIPSDTDALYSFDFIYDELKAFGYYELYEEENGEVLQSDFIYSRTVNNGKLEDFIPYEWTENTEETADERY